MRKLREKYTVKVDWESEEKKYNEKVSEEVIWENK